mgnify:CR=1 FL=1
MSFIWPNIVYHPRSQHHPLDQGEPRDVMPWPPPSHLWRVPHDRESGLRSLRRRTGNHTRCRRRHESGEEGRWGGGGGWIVMMGAGFAKSSWLCITLLASVKSKEGMTALHALRAFGLWQECFPEVGRFRMWHLILFQYLKFKPIS